MNRGRRGSGGPGSLFRPLGVLRRGLALGSTGHRTKMFVVLRQDGGRCCSGSPEPGGCLPQGGFWAGLMLPGPGDGDAQPPVACPRCSIASPQSCVFCPQS